MSKTTQVDLIAEVFDLFNRPNYILGTQESSLTYNKPTSGQYRTMQFGFRLVFLKRRLNHEGHEEHEENQNTKKFIFLCVLTFVAFVLFVVQAVFVPSVVEAQTAGHAFIPYTDVEPIFDALRPDLVPADLRGKTLAERQATLARVGRAP